MKIKQYLFNLLISVDQFVNTIFAGDPDETISSRIGKKVVYKQDTGWRLWLCNLLDFADKGHCLNSIEPDRGDEYD